MQTKKVSTLQRKRGGGIKNETAAKSADKFVLHEIKDSKGKPVTEYNLNSIFNFFEIADDRREYLKNALIDAAGLYSLIIWVNKNGTFIYNNSVIRPATNNNLKKLEVKKYKKNFELGYEANPYELLKTYKGSKRMYKYMGTFIKAVASYEGIQTQFKCEIFSDTSDDNILVLFKWGGRYNLTIPKYKTILDNMFIFIVDKIYSTYSNSNILLFGFSMGANIAQHIALRFIDNEDILKNMKDIDIDKTKLKLMKKNIYIVSLGAGGTMTSETMATFNKNFTGKFLSIAIAVGFDDSPMAADDKMILDVGKKQASEDRLGKKDTVCTGLQAQCNGTAVTSILHPPGVGLEFNVDGTEKKKSFDNYNAIEKQINTNILQDANEETVKSLIINMDEYSAETDKIGQKQTQKQKYKLGRLYDHSGLTNVSFRQVIIYHDPEPGISNLHDYKLYRMCIEMLVTGNTTADAPK